MYFFVYHGMTVSNNTENIKLKSNFHPNSSETITKNNDGDKSSTTNGLERSLSPKNFNGWERTQGIVGKTGG